MTNFNDKRSTEEQPSLINICLVVVSGLAILKSRRRQRRRAVDEEGLRVTRRAHTEVIQREHLS